MSTAGEAYDARAREPDRKFQTKCSDYFLHGGQKPMLFRTSFLIVAAGVVLHVAVLAICAALIALVLLLCEIL